MRPRNRQHDGDVLLEQVYSSSKRFFEVSAITEELDTQLLAPYRDTLSAHGFKDDRVFSPLVRATPSGTGWRYEFGCGASDPLQQSNRLDVTWTIDIKMALHVPGVCAAPRVWLSLAGARDIRIQGRECSLMHADYSFGPLQAEAVVHAQHVDTWMTKAWTTLQATLANQDLVAAVVVQQWTNSLMP